MRFVDLEQFMLWAEDAAKSLDSIDKSLRVISGRSRLDDVEDD